MTTTLKTCHKCGRRYQAWRCPNCYKGHSHHSAGGSTFSRRGGAASVLGHNWGEYDAVMGRVVEEVNTWEPIDASEVNDIFPYQRITYGSRPLTDEQFDALNAQEDANRAAIREENNWSRGL